SLNDINEATTVIYEAAGPDANIIFGAVIDPSMNGDLRVTVIATGFHNEGLNGSFYNERAKKISNHTLSESTKYMPLFQKMETETLEKTLGDIFGNDGGIPLISKEDLDVPTFIRRRAE
ncbi:hypothetical protein MUP95_09725, partial [bacterium]|nr:hypothetical protein [bacterium]